MLKYMTRYNKIEAVEVVRETPQQVVILNRSGRETRENKRSDSWSNWHDTWEAAHAFLVAEAEDDMEGLRKRLERASEKLIQIKTMKPNEGSSDDK